MKDAAWKELLRGLAEKRVRVRLRAVSIDDFGSKGGPVHVLGLWATNLRDEPASVVAAPGKKQLGVTPSGSSLLVTAASGQWLEVDADGRKGYVRRAGFDLTRSAAAIAAAAAPPPPIKKVTKPAKPELDPLVRGIARALGGTGF